MGGGGAPGRLRCLQEGASFSLRELSQLTDPFRDRELVCQLIDARLVQFLTRVEKTLYNGLKVAAQAQIRPVLTSRIENVKLMPAHLNYKLVTIYSDYDLLICVDAPKPNILVD